MAHLVKLHDDNPDARKVQEVVRVLNNNGLIVCPTDTVYSFAAKLGSPKGFDRLARAKGVKPEKAQFLPALRRSQRPESVRNPHQ